jgi:hypothetical protein
MAGDDSTALEYDSATVNRAVRTLEGIVAGRDEVVERAFELVGVRSQ